MNNWITIISFTYPHEAHIVKGKLESEDIPVQITDEITAQVNTFYSNAIGGVKLQVQENHYERAYQILIDAGYIQKPKPLDNNILTRLNKTTSKLPFIGKTRIELRLIIIIALILLVILIPIAIASIPTTFEKLTQNRWCVDRLIYKGQELSPNTIEKVNFRFVSEYDNCSEIIYFNEDNTVYLPGINSSGIEAIWKIKNDSMIIKDLYYKINKNTGKSIYYGTHYLEINNGEIRIQSDSLTIIGRAYKFQFNWL